MTLAPGVNIGPYRIIEPIGRGGMASVFKAYEASLDRYVALKVLPPEFLHDPTFAERFRREAQTIARLEHPQIIPIFAYDIDAPSGTPWMAMRLISGGSLSQRIKRGRLAHSECARILKDVGDALDYAHGAGVIHRDVKPQNVLLDDAGRVYLADFGIAKIVEASAHMTQTGMITGTPQYMAPEQALGKPIDKSIDIYALGIVAYELFTGSVPFSADTPVAVLMKQASEPMPLPPVSEVPETVTRAILRATAKDPLARWPSASAFAKAVGSATATSTAIDASLATSAMPSLDLDQETIQGVPAPTEIVRGKGPSTARPRSSDTPDPSTRRKGSGVGLAAAVLIGLALLAAGATYVGYRLSQSTKGPETAAVAPTATIAPATPVAPEPAPPAPVAEAASTASPSATVQPTQAPVAPAERADAAAGAPEFGPRGDPRLDPRFDRLTPQERRALLARGPLGRREKMEAMAEARRRLAGQGQTAPGGVIPLPPAAEAMPVRPARTRIVLEVEASQPSTGNQINALFAQVEIDGRPVREFVIRFTGANTFARWKKVERVVLENVPLSAREITLVVATDPGLNEERMEDSTRLSLEGEETNVSVEVRFYNQFDKSVKFR